MTTKEQLDDRYGRSKRTGLRIGLVVVAVVAAAIVGLLVWSVWSSSSRSVDFDDLGFRVVDDSQVELSFRVTSAHQEDVTCVLEALDTSFGVVGWEVVELDGGSVTADYTETIRTVDTATTGYVNSCSLR